MHKQIIILLLTFAVSLHAEMKCEAGKCSTGKSVVKKDIPKKESIKKEYKQLESSNYYSFAKIAFQENQYNGDSEMKRVGRMVLNKEITLTSDKPVDFGNWNIFSLDLAKLIQTEPGAIYNVSITFDRSHSLLPCASGDKEEGLKPFKQNREMERFNDPPTGNYYWDYGYYEEYKWREREDPCTDSYYIFKKRRNDASRNVLASDLGIIAKGGNGTDLFGFSGLPGGGYLYNSGSFYYIGLINLCWSSTDGNSTCAWNRYTAYNTPQVDRDFGNDNKEFGFSVRCIRND